MTHSYEDIIRLHEYEVPSTPFKVISHSWRETSIYDAKKRRVCLFDLEDWGVTENNQYELEIKQHNLAQYIAAMPDAVGLLKLYKQLLDRAIQALEDAKENIIEWGAYAGSYHQEKWDLQGDIQSIEQTLADIRKQLNGDTLKTTTEHDNNTEKRGKR